MTAIVAIENTEDLEERITLPYEIFPPLYAKNASMAGFQPGEEVSLKDLLYGIMLPPPERSAALVLPDGWQVQRNSLYL